MLSALLLTGARLQAKARAACRAAGLSAGPPGRFGPGLKALLLLDGDSFRRLVRVGGGVMGFARMTAEWPVVVLLEASESVRVQRAVADADAVGVLACDLDDLPLLLRRLVWGGGGPEPGCPVPSPPPSRPRTTRQNEKGRSSGCPQDLVPH